MFSNIWNALFYKPLLNALAFLISIIPGGDVGIAIVLLTILVKIAILPFSQHAIENQNKMSALSPELKKIKDSGVSKEEQARLTFELYKKHKTNPFSGCLVQIPVLIIIIALYSVFNKGLSFENGSLYSFIHVPENINMFFLGLIDISKQSILLATLAALSQHAYAYFLPIPSTSSDPNSFQHNLGKSMSFQMKYLLPIFIFVILGTDFIGVSVSGAVALYWITSNIFAIGQQIYANKKKNVLVIN